MRADDLKYRVKVGILIAINIAMLTVVARAAWGVYNCFHGRCGGL
jgi:hypothetical protein